MKINKSPKPIFDTDDDRTYFLVNLPINEYFIEDKAQDKAQDKFIKRIDMININNLNKTEFKLIEMLKESDMSKIQIIKLLVNSKFECI